VTVTTTETVPEQISSRFAREVTTAPSGGESDSPSSSPPRNEPMFCLERVSDEEATEPGGTVWWAPADTDPREVGGWTNVGWIEDEAELFKSTGNLVETFHATWTHEFPRISRETITVALGEDAAKIVAEQWPPEPDPLADLIRASVTTSPYVPPGVVIVGSPVGSFPGRMGVVDVLPPADDDWWTRDMFAYRAAERIAMTVPRYDLTVTSSVPTIGYPPLKSHGLGGRRYRAARRAYARKRRAWIRQGSPTYPTMIRMPQVVITGIA
jgi:hypothetical protein